MASPAPRELEAVIELMARLPGLGPRSARRAVLALLKKRDGLMIPLARCMADLALTAKTCAQCGNIGPSDPCNICADPARATGEICVLADVADLWAMERGGAFKGRYHILGGTLSPLDNLGPEELHIPQLVTRVAGEGISEIILALNATVDGQTTAHYIIDALRGAGVKITSLAQGVPIGGELDYLDDGTINAAWRARRRV